MNNFDQSSTGTDIEFSISWDSDLAQHYFEENFETLEKGHQQTTVLFFIDSGQVSPPTYTEDLFDFDNCTRKDFREFVIANSVGSLYAVRDVIADRVYQYDSWKDMALEIINDTSFSEFVAGNINLKNATPLYKSQSVTGHSQGDYIEVIYKASKDWEPSNNYLTNLAFNAQLHCVLIVNGDDYFINSSLRDPYDYDKEEILDAVRSYNLPQQVFDFVEENLPEWPEYI